MAERTDARRIAEIAPGILGALHRGEEETRNLVEWLAIDDRRLLRALLPRARALHARADALAGAGVMTRVAEIGRGLAAEGADWRPLARHPSDRARCYAAYAAVASAPASFAARLRRLRPFADDPHFGVREIAWSALRPFVAEDPRGAIRALAPLCREKSAFLRRFASEATRPRGVWCAHIPSLKADPSPGLAILDPLSADPSRYVQDSVGNWLNDAAKSAPDFVREVCARWRAASADPATGRIVARALRSLR